jgi:hypothetical protein
MEKYAVAIPKFRARLDHCAVLRSARPIRDRSAPRRRLYAASGRGLTDTDVTRPAAGDLTDISIFMNSMTVMTSPWRPRPLLRPRSPRRCLGPWRTPRPPHQESPERRHSRPRPDRRLVDLHLPPAHSLVLAATRVEAIRCLKYACAMIDWTSSIPSVCTRT